MKILLFGKTGLLGRALFSVLKNAHIVIAKSHKECDICDLPALESQIAEERPDLVINATGYTNVDAAELESEKAFAVNTEAVRNLAQFLERLHIPLVHFSTDYVFDGKVSSGYSESDIPSPLSVYGKSKAEGEQAVRTIMKHYYLLRTSWLFGEGSKNFVDTMIDLSRAREPIRVVNDQIGSPTHTLDLAQAVLHLLKEGSYGIYHIVNEGTSSWYEFAKEIFRQIGLPQAVIPISSQELNRPAKRPACSILRNTKLPPLRHWKDALASYLMHKTLIL